MSFFAIIPAAGIGARFGSKKQFLELKGQSPLQRTVATFQQTGLFKNIVVVLSPDEMERDLGVATDRCAGGTSRAESVKKGFEFLKPMVGDIVVIHDAVRCLIKSDLIQRVCDAALLHKAVIPVVKVSDTIKEVLEGRVVKTHNREHLRAVQTPQAFSCELMSRMYKTLALTDLERLTDESSGIEQLGETVYVVDGDLINIKITTPEDVAAALSHLTS